MKKLKNFEKHYLESAYKLAIALLKQPNSAAEICKLSTKKMLADLEKENRIPEGSFRSEYSHFCQLTWSEVTNLVEFYLHVLANSNIKISKKQSKEKYIGQANKVFAHAAINIKLEKRNFSNMTTKVLGLIHYHLNIKLA